jgi:RHS repeat-associated protein
MKFTGHERDLASPGGAADDLDYMHARHESPVTGRFLSVDPVLGIARSPQSWNRYAYTSGRPLNFVDSYGRSIWEKVFKVLRHLPDGTRRLVARIEGTSKQKVIERTRQALDKIDSREANQGIKRVVQAETEEARDAIAKQLSLDKRMRGPEKSGGKANTRYPEHVHPKEGPYEDVHVEAVKVIGAAGFMATLSGIFAPTTSAVVESGDATPGELLSAAAWDVTSTVDPIGISDAISWYFDID